VADIVWRPYHKMIGSKIAQPRQYLGSPHGGARGPNPAAHRQPAAAPPEAAVGFRPFKLQLVM
jgi:hypothetical protein